MARNDLLELSEGRVPPACQDVELFERRTFANLHACAADRERLLRITEIVERHLFDTVSVWRPLPGYLDCLKERGSPLKLSICIGVKTRDEKGARSVPGLPAQRLQFVKDFRDHPNVGAWDFFDELVPGRPDEVRRIVETVRGADPTHPLAMNVVPWFWCAYRAKAQLEQLDQIGAVFDIVSSDAYPVVRYPLALKRREAAVIRERVPPTAQTTSVIQVSKFGADRFPHWSAAPLPEEVRAMAYYSLVEGIDQLNYWTLGGEPNSFGTPYRNMLGDQMLPTARLNEVGVLNAETLLVEPFLGRKHWVRSGEDAEAGIVFGEFEKEGHRLLLVQKVGTDEYLTGTSRAATISVSAPGADFGAYDVSFPAVEPLPHRRREDELVVEVPSVEATKMILVTNDELLLEWVRTRMEDLLPAVTAMRLRSAAWKIALADREERVLRELAADTPAAAAAQEARLKAKRLRDRALALYKAGDLPASFAASHEAHRELNGGFQALRNHAKQYALPLLPAERFREASTLKAILDRRSSLPHATPTGTARSLWVYGCHLARGFHYSIEARPCGDAAASPVVLGELPPKGQNAKFKMGAFVYPVPDELARCEAIELVVRHVGGRGAAGAVPGDLFGIYLMPSSLDPQCAPELWTHARDWVRSHASGCLEFGPFLHLNMIVIEDCAFTLSAGRNQVIPVADCYREHGL